MCSIYNIYDKENPAGVIVQFGGQTPLNLAEGLEAYGVPIIGTSPESIRRAEDRESFKQVLDKLGLVQPANDTATSLEGARQVLGGRAMQIVYNEKQLNRYMSAAVEASPGHPILIDKFVEDAIEVDVDAIADGQRCVIGGIMEHIEEAGIHSGDSACVLPAFSLAEEELAQIQHQTKALARELRVVGLMNIQYAIRNDVLYVLEVNPRASRTIPFVSKTIGVPLAQLAAPVFPFSKFAGIDTILGPEMKSTGEVMGIDTHFGAARRP